MAVGPVMSFLMLRLYTKNVLGCLQMKVLRGYLSLVNKRQIIGGKEGHFSSSTFLCISRKNPVSEISQKKSQSLVNRKISSFEQTNIISLVIYSFHPHA